MFQKPWTTCFANFVFNEFKRALAEGEVNLNATDDIRVVLVMTNTTFDTEDDINTLGDATTPDYCDGTNHDSTNGHALASEVVGEDAANNRAEFDATDLTFTALGVGTRQNQGMVLFKWITNLASSLPIGFIDTGGFPFDGNGGDVVSQWNVEGILQIA